MAPAVVAVQAQAEFPSRLPHAVKRERASCSGRIVPKIRGGYVCLVCERCGGTVGAIDTPVFQALFPATRLAIG